MNDKMQQNSQKVQPIDLAKLLEDYQSESYLEKMLKGHSKDFEYSYDENKLKDECIEIKNECEKIQVECTQFATSLENFQSRQSKIKNSTETVKNTVTEVKNQVKDIQKKLQEAEEEMNKHKQRYSELIEAQPTDDQDSAVLSAQINNQE